MTATHSSPSESTRSPDQMYRETLRQTLQQAVRCHVANQIPEADHLYRTVLQVQPLNPKANHNLGVLLLEKQQHAASLPHFEAAVAAQPESQRYWLSYIEALVLAGETELAQRTLSFSREHGLEGKEVEVLARKIEAGSQAALAQAKPASPARRQRKRQVRS